MYIFRFLTHPLLGMIQALQIVTNTATTLFTYIVFSTCESPQIEQLNMYIFKI